MPTFPYESESVRALNFNPQTPELPPIPPNPSPSPRGGWECCPERLQGLSGGFSSKPNMAPWAGVGPEKPVHSLRLAPWDI